MLLRLGGAKTCHCRAATIACVAKKRATWAEVGLQHAGFRATVRALRFAMAWGLATAELGREPESIDEYAEVMQENRRTAFRDQAAFREAFPMEDSPGRMNQVTGAQDRYNAAYKRLKSVGAALSKVESVTFDVGSAPADI